MLWLKLQYFGHLMEEVTHLKRPWCWKILRAGEEGDDRGWDGWMASLSQLTWVLVNSRSFDGQGGLECCDSWSLKGLDTTEQLNCPEGIRDSKRVLRGNWLYREPSSCCRYLKGNIVLRRSLLKATNIYGNDNNDTSSSLHLLNVATDQESF